MISYEQAISIIRAEGQKASLNPEAVPVDQVAGRHAAQDIISSMANQPFDNSAMDGFAVRAADLVNAAAALPVSLAQAGQIIAGMPAPEDGYQPGTCHEIMTGAMMPDGYDSIVPVEKITRNDGQIVFTSAVAPGEYVRRAGADIRPGEAIFKRGDLFTAEHILPLATLGAYTVDVLRRARVSVISTGNEVVDDLRASLQKGRIYNSTAPYLRQAVPAAGMELLSIATVADDPRLFRQMLEQVVAKGSDIIITTGAVSAGVHDFVPSVLKEMGADIFFHKVAIRPGRPILFARLSPSGPFFVGLPGNPASTSVGLRFFVRPLLRAMQGFGSDAPKKAVLADDLAIRQPVSLRLFLRAQTGINAQGAMQIAIIPGQQSFMVRPFVLSNVWAVLPPDAGSLKKGDIVDFYD